MSSSRGRAERCPSRLTVLESPPIPTTSKPGAKLAACRRTRRLFPAKAVYFAGSLPPLPFVVMGHGQLCHAGSATWAVRLAWLQDGGGAGHPHPRAADCGWSGTTTSIGHPSRTRAQARAPAAQFLIHAPCSSRVLEIVAQLARQASRRSRQLRIYNEIASDLLQIILLFSSHQCPKNIPPVAGKHRSFSRLLDAATGSSGRHGQLLQPTWIGEAVWTGNAPEGGFLALGTPVGHPAFTLCRTQTRASGRRPGCCKSSPCCRTCNVRGVLAMCAAPRAYHLLRTLPPDLSASYARGHDDAVWQCLRDRLGEPDDQDPEVAAARRLALLPARLGGLGLQCVVRGRSCRVLGRLGRVFGFTQRFPELSLGYNIVSP